MKTYESLTMQDVESRGREALEALLSRVRGLRVVDNQWVSRPTGHPSDPGYDFQQKIETADGKSWWICAAVKSAGHPKQVRNAAWGLKRLEGREDLGAPVSLVIIAPFLSEDSIRICQEEGVGYLDLSGNCHLEFGGIFLHVEGKPNQFKETRGIKTLFSPKASRILYPLLQGPLRAWKVEELAMEAGVSLGLVSKVRRVLLDQDLASDNQGGLLITRPDALLEKWVQADNWEKRTETREYSLLENDPEKIASKLEPLIAGKKHAFTRWYGAFLRQPYTLPTMTTIYVEDFPDEEILKKKLHARRVDGGGGLSLVKPKDKGIFQGLQEIRGRKVVCDVQLYLDVIHAGLRGDEAAEELRKAENFSGGWK